LLLRSAEIKPLLSDLFFSNFVWNSSSKRFRNLFLLTCERKLASLYYCLLKWQGNYVVVVHVFIHFLFS